MVHVQIFIYTSLENLFLVVKSKSNTKIGEAQHSDAKKKALCSKRKILQALKSLDAVSANTSVINFHACKPAYTKISYLYICNKNILNACRRTASKVTIGQGELYVILSIS